MLIGLGIRAIFNDFRVGLFVLFGFSQIKKTSHSREEETITISPAKHKLLCCSFRVEHTFQLVQSTLVIGKNLVRRSDYVPALCEAQKHPSSDLFGISHSTAIGKML